MEWTGEMLQTADTKQGPTWLASDMVGPGSNKWYPKLATDYSAIITDLQLVPADAKTPNNVLGEVAYDRATDAAKYEWQLIPGNVL